MREIVPPQHIVHANDVAELDAEIVLHELHEHVPVPVIAGEQPFPGFPPLGEHRPLAVREVHLLQPVRDPGHLVLDRAHLQVRVAVEYPGEQHGTQRVAHPVIGRGAACPSEIIEVHGELTSRDAPPVRPDMQEQGDVQVLSRPPESLIDGVAIRPVRHGIHRDESPNESQVCTAFQLLAGIVHIVHIQHRDALQPLGIGCAEVGDPIVVDPADGREQLAIRYPVPEEPLAGLQARTPHPIEFVLLDHGVGVVGGLADVVPDAEEIDVRGIFKSLSGLDHRAEGPHLQPIDKPGIVLSSCRRFPLLHAWRPVSEFRLDATRVHIRWLDDMGIRRDQFVCCHDTFPPLCVAPTSSCHAGYQAYVGGWLFAEGRRVAADYRRHHPGRGDPQDAPPSEARG